MQLNYNEKGKIPSMVCMPFSLNILRRFGVFPPKGNELNPSYRFYLKAFFLLLFASLPWISSITHFIQTVRLKQYHHTELDINYAVSFATTIGQLFAFMIKIKSAGQLYTFLSDFEDFGKPTNFDENNKLFSKFARMHFAYLECLIWFIICTSNIFQTGTCRRENKMFNMTEVCGLFTYTSMPFNIDFTPVREIFMLVQVFGVHHMYMLAGLMAWQVFETMQHVIIRIRHVKYVFIDALALNDPVERRLKFNLAVRYHNAILSLEEKLNDTYSIFIFTHMVLTAAVLGSGTYSLLHARSLSTFMVCTGWFWGLFMDCFSGQRLQDESSELVFAVYDSAWYEYEQTLQKDVMYVIKKCQNHMKLRAASFGIMDRAMFLAVLKVTYSYITLLKNA